MKKHVLLSIVFFFISTTINTKIIESNSVKTLLHYLQEPNTLVIFDIDNTLARPEHELGSDEWFCYLVDQKVTNGHDKISAVNTALPLYYYAQFNLPLVLTEPLIPNIMNNLTNRNICTMGLTSRGLHMAERTNEQLSNININFNMPCTDKEELIIPMPYPCLYKYNTIFASNNDKGNTILKFLDIINYHPQCIIFLDDKMYHVVSVEKAALSHNISYIGIRYSGCDDRINHFDPAKAALQLQELRQHNKILAH